MAKRRARRREPHACLTKGCGATIPGWQRLCTPCFRRLPFDQRRAIAQAGEAKAQHLVSQLCMDAARFLEANPPGVAAAKLVGEKVDG